MDLLYRIATDPAITGLVMVALADTAIGITQAIRRGEFDVAYVANFVGTHLVGRVAPIAALLVLGYNSEPLAAAGALAAAAYVAETVGSIRAHFGLDPAADGSEADEPA